ncbi:SusE domain-containing protein [Polaribacter sp. Hel1_85]|uniref:SusE domain-containing protein n=1 Tax=Polaribacter sp. Hel1_85 TaxID=1250005 RepID=UPI00052BC1F7|nr:SusE domain-containing protein [Polaribacter sp. Hel1_85]KGL63871.1 SusE-like outer membrane protein [Polaribacter sp. Hel1_85]
MKKYKKILSTLFLACTIVFFSSCEDNTEIFKVSDNASAPILVDLPVQTIELDAINVNNPAITLTWEAAEYGQQTPVKYIIEFANNESFTNSVKASSIISDNFITLSSNQLNTLAGNAGLLPFEWTTIYTRVVSFLGTLDGVPLTSNTIQFDVLPYYNYIYDDYYLVGNATAPDWGNNNNNPALFRDETNKDKFYYTGYFGAGEFKILETKGFWQPQWGTNDASTIDVNPGGGTDPGSFPNNNSPIATAGYYQFTIDFKNKNFSFLPFDASAQSSPATLTLQGTSTENIAMTQLNGNFSSIWYANSVKLTRGEVSFLTDEGATWGNTTAFSGVAANGGDSIPVEVEDDYDVWFNDLTGRYILIPLNL